ncbi:MAG: amino acid racemase [archaeon]
MNKKTIGLLGGIGPESTGLFYLALINGFVQKYKPKDNTEYPHIIINSIPAPDLVLNVGNDQILSSYIEGLKFLEKNKPDTIAIICNTAHVYLNKLQKEVSIPIINLPNEVRNHLYNSGFKSVTVLATLNTLENNLYKFEGIEYNDISKIELEDLTKAISSYNLGIDMEKQKVFVHELINKYLKISDCIILGCTEVALMGKDVSANTIDTMEVLISSILREYEK